MKKHPLGAFTRCMGICFGGDAFLFMRFCAVDLGMPPLNMMLPYKTIIIAAEHLYLELYMLVGRSRLCRYTCGMRKVRGKKVAYRAVKYK